MPQSKKSWLSTDSFVLDKKKNVNKDAKILVVDDERVNRELLAMLLESEGHVVAQAATGREVISIFQDDTEIDLMLLDISMPEVDGYTVLAYVREIYDATELPVVMVTASQQNDEIIRAFKLGANDFITKPIDPEIALTRISSQLTLRRLRAELLETQERYALAARGANDGLWDWNLNNDQMYVSSRWKAMLGFGETDKINLPQVWLERVHPDDSSEFELALKRHLYGNSPKLEHECRVRHTSGHYFWVLCRGMAVRDEEGNAYRVAGSLSDITEAKVADPLTDLPNRVLFLEHLQRGIDQYRRDPERNFAVLFLDLDNFKLVNDSHGHAAGDNFLCAISARLSNALSTSESIVARLGGDEFAIAINDITSIAPAVRMAQKMLKSLEEPIILEEQTIYPSVSIGISYSTQPNLTAEDVLREADTAMYQAKESGKSCYRLFDPEMQKQVKRRLTLENELRRGVARNEFVLAYQPIFELQTETLIGFEALIRWQHPTRGIVSPMEFIEIAEKTSLIIPIGEFVLEEACQQLVAWKKASPVFSDVVVNVNLSRIQLQSGDCAASVRSILRRTRLPAESLVLEITESCIFERGSPMKILDELKSHKVALALDDFGTGHSSLSCLHSLPLDTIKIDRAFINEMLIRSKNSAIVKAILSLADGLGLDVCAEGIEEQAQHNFLKSLGCKFGQGYLYSKPLFADDFFRYATNTKFLEPEPVTQANKAFLGKPRESAQTIPIAVLPTVPAVDANHPAS